MTTDNRTPKQKQNQILPNFACTDEQVEAAAKAINLAGWTFEGVCEPGEYCDECRKVCEEVARAALVAAQGAAPQAEGDVEIHEQVRRVIEGAMSEAWSDAEEYEHLPEVAATRVVERFNLAAPVLPSSTVDEDALWKVVRVAKNDWLRRCGQPGHVEDIDVWIARAVAEWLKGQGR